MLVGLKQWSALVLAALAVARASHVHVRVHTSEIEEENVGGSDMGSADGGSSWQMKPVRSIHARVQGDLPIWENETQRWTSKFGDTIEDRYFSALANVNTASPEGALYYVQAECINVRDQSVKCVRKNKVKYVVFYETVVSQPEYSMAVYGSDDTPEYCPYLAFDGGKCTNAGDDLPQACKQFYGLDSEMNLGVCLGAGNKETAKRGPYPGAYWFSFPGGCAQKEWGEKTSECSAKYPTGMCPLGVTPDGHHCVYSYKILGAVAIDDVVGITEMVSSKTNERYTNFKEFCEDGQVEFEAKTKDGAFDVIQSLPFWENPGDREANQRRYEHMVKVYNSGIESASTEGTMYRLPSVEELTAENPKCYETNAKCATAKHGCRRMWHSQLCGVCRADEPGCEKPPAGFTFAAPEQPPKPTKAPEDTESEGGSEIGSSSDANDDSYTSNDDSDTANNNGKNDNTNDSNDDTKDGNSAYVPSLSSSLILGFGAVVYTLAL